MYPVAGIAPSHDLVVGDVVTLRRVEIDPLGGGSGNVYSVLPYLVVLAVEQVDALSIGLGYVHLVVPAAVVVRVAENDPVAGGPCGIDRVIGDVDVG